MKKTWLSCLLTIFIGITMVSTAFAGAANNGQKEITISAAVSLKNTFSDIAKLYESKNSSIKCVLNFGASGDLMKQIAGGAPVDVFASASQKDMNELDKLQMLVNKSRFDFAANSIVLVTPVNTKIDIKSFEELKSEKINKIAVGNPKSVPAGRYADEVLNFYKLLPSIKDKLIYTENVRQVLDYVARGEVDAGIVYATDAEVRAEEVNLIAIAPDTSHKPVVYPIAVVKGTKNEIGAKNFISLVLSSEGQSILHKYGFQSIKQ